MARNLIKAIGDGWAEGDVELVSELRTLVSDGDAAAQTAMFETADAEATRLIETLRDQDIGMWVTYHNYYKAPDLLGPKVSAALDVPYVIIEASRAQSRLTGPWARFAAASEAACNAADVIYYVIELDAFALKRDKPEGQQLIHLRPFLPITTLPVESGRDPGQILTVGMFRGRDKLGSYEIIADALAHLSGDHWRLDIAGDGPARAQVERLMQPFGDRVHFLGQLDRDALNAAYGRSAIFLWPGFNEAFGLVYLEAQAAGLPVVAQDRDGVRDVVLPGQYPIPEDGPAALATMLQTLLDDPDQCRTLGQQARSHVATRHLADTARDTFWQAARPLLKGQT
ncbi:MAG: glycosyltransferase family 4 protein [Paracoccaceae bacterium]